MPLKLMYITNNPEIALIAEAAGVDRIFVDMEYIGKADRQGGMNTVQSKHTFEDVSRIRKTIKNELIVRCNPIHEATEKYIGSKEEIESICTRGADIVMLPYFKAKKEVEKFVHLINGRAKTMILVETPEAVNCIDDILAIEGIDEIHIGLNDLSLGYEKKFMFELLIDGTVEMLCKKFERKGIPYGFGGIASLGKGMLPAEHVIAEHYRLGSKYAILSRSFCNVNEIKILDEVETIFYKGIRDIRAFEAFCASQDEAFFEQNKKVIFEKVNKILGK